MNDAVPTIDEGTDTPVDAEFSERETRVQQAHSLDDDFQDVASPDLNAEDEGKEHNPTNFVHLPLKDRPND